MLSSLWKSAVVLIFCAAVRCEMPASALDKSYVFPVNEGNLVHYQRFLNGRDPLAIEEFSGSNLNRHVFEMITFQRALHEGGCKCKVEYVPFTADTSHARAIVEVKAGRDISHPVAGFDTDPRYVEPVEAAIGFAADYLGFVDPIAGDFMAGDNRSGEVEIRTFDGGPPTVVFVRQLTADDSWWILGAASGNVTIDEPAALAEVTSPLTVSGTALAFEGTVDVQLRADGNGEPIFEGFVTGSGGPDPGPYAETFEFTSPGQTGGALVMLSLSSEDGSPLEASALRIFYP